MRALLTLLPATPLVRVVAALLACTWLGEVVFLLRLPLVEQVGHVPDDSFFYLRVAQWFWRTGEFTFDGSNPTYGYQPLWQLVLCLLAPLLPGKAALLHGVQVLCALEHVAIGGLLFALGRSIGGAVAGAVAALLWTWNPATMVWCWGLKENSLYALLLLGALLQLLALLRGGVRARGAAGFGVLLGLIVCTRLNAVLVTGPLLLALPFALGLGGGARARLRGAAVALLAALAAGGPWYLFAALHFGCVMPTSGQWKQTMATAHVEHVWGTPWLSVAHGLRALGEWPGYLAALFERGFGPWRWLLAALLPLAVAAVLVPAWRAQRPPGDRAGRFVLALAAATALFASFADQMLLPNYIGYADWYAVAFDVAVPLLGGALTAAAVPWCLRPLRAVGLLVVAGAMLLLPPTLGSAARLQRGLLAQPPRGMATLELGLWANEHVPPDTRCGLWDPGVISYFSGRKCVSFDPLISAVDYARPVVGGLPPLLDPVGYLKRQGIAYMFGVAEQQQGVWQYWPLPQGSFDIVWLPYPDHDVGWGAPGQAARQHVVVVRPHDAPVPEFLREDDFPCGLLYPNDPARRRWITRDRDRLVAGVLLQADALRLLLAVPPDGELQLRIDAAVVQTFAAGTAGWRCLDARPWRGRRVQVSAVHCDAAVALPQAQLVDYTLVDR